MPGVSAGKDGAAITQPGIESLEMSPGACGSLKMKPSLAMFRNMNVYMSGTSDARSTPPGAKEFCTFTRAREMPAGRFVRARIVAALVPDKDICKLHSLEEA
ncbi:hypothetical protein GCM10009776_33740 [Microbacterium deminutum]|uniref:Uncharacterized protein n=1 Tax=Microbacterium deminutum TaxID=344164 RepID=A0ABN2REZ4_9MICO